VCLPFSEHQEAKHRSKDNDCNDYSYYPRFKYWSDTDSRSIGVTVIGFCYAYSSFCICVSCYDNSLLIKIIMYPAASCRIQLI
jgi:hypothetical protein